MKIAVDGMGGDNAPEAIVEGAVLFVKQSDSEVILVGKQDILETELKRHIYPKEKISIRHASEIVEMCDSPAVNIRKKKDSSVNVAVKMVKNGEADAIVTAGNTGAAVCAATLTMRLLKGIERAGIAIVFPTLTGACLLIDVGANIDCKPLHLLQYAIMGKVYSKYIMKNSAPTVGLLNIGEEESKGTDFVKETHALLNKSGLNFIGNVEGRDLFTGKGDVVVCDGFVGNIVLKVSESLIETFTALLRKELTKSLITKIGALLAKPAFYAIKKDIDYAEYGGAPLLGINGTCIICHGSSSPKAIKNAIRVAGEFVSYGVNKHIEEGIAKYGLQ